MLIIFMLELKIYHHKSTHDVCATDRGYISMNKECFIGLLDF